MASLQRAPPTRTVNAAVVGSGLASASAEDDTALGEVVGRERYLHLVAQDDADGIFAHLAGGVGENLVPVFELHAKHAALQNFTDSSVNFNLIFARHPASGLK